MRHLFPPAIALLIATMTPAELASEPAWECGREDNKLSKRFYARNALLEDYALNRPAPLRVSPAQGEARQHLSNASQLLRKKPYIQSFIVAKSNKIVFEDYFNGMAENNSVNVHSVAKSIWGAATGIALSKKILPSVDTPIKALLPEDYGQYFDGTSVPITLRHLLTMTSCLKWDEDVTERNLAYIDAPEGNGRDWIAAILERGMRPPRECTVGKTFNYSTGNSQLLSAILDEALTRKDIDQSTCEFIQENLLDKIGVAPERWAFYEQGYFAGGHSLWLSPRELMKFGLLYLNNGSWNNRQIVPRRWAESSKIAQTKCQSPGCSLSDDARPPDGYGYYFWLGRIGGHRVTMSWGYGGQMIYMFDDLGAVVVITTDTVKYTYDGDDSGGDDGKSDIPERTVMDYLEQVLKDEVIPAVQ